MATKVIKNPTVKLNAVDISSACFEARLEIRTENQDETAFGDSWRTRKPGLGDWNCTLQMHQDRATGVVDDTIFSMAGPGDGSSYILLLYPSGTTISVENPEYSGAVLVENYGAVQATQGQLENVQCSLVGAGQLFKATS